MYLWQWPPTEYLIRVISLRRLMVGHPDEITCMAIDRNAKNACMRKNAFVFGTTVWHCIMKTS